MAPGQGVDTVALSICATSVASIAFGDALLYPRVNLAFYPCHGPEPGFNWFGEATFFDLLVSPGFTVASSAAYFG